MARDLDLLRRAVGDSRLTYVGHSSGSMLGATYANLFPGKVRSIVLDSVLDPVGYTRGIGPFSLRVDSQRATSRTLRFFLRRATRPASSARSRPAIRWRSSTR